MIRIIRPAPPDKFVVDGDAKAQAHCCEVDEDANSYLTGKRCLTFDGAVYGSAKEHLLAAQFNKCCYCERNITAGYWGDVEHFRPKGAFRQDENSPVQHPGYYWLAYTWENLLVSCAVCNTRYKQIYFPLDDPAQRARTHHDDVTQEDPLLVDPGGENPREHITYRGDAPEGRTVKGRETIRRLGLRRADLVELRLERLRGLKNALNVLSLAKVYDLPEDTPEVIEAKETLQNAIEPSSEYTSMALDFLEAYGYIISEDV